MPTVTVPIPIAVTIPVTVAIPVTAPSVIPIVVAIATPPSVIIAVIVAVAASPSVIIAVIVAIAAPPPAVVAITKDSTESTASALQTADLATFLIGLPAEVAISVYRTIQFTLLLLDLLRAVIARLCRCTRDENTAK